MNEQTDDTQTNREVKIHSIYLKESPYLDVLSEDKKGNDFVHFMMDVS